MGAETFDPEAIEQAALAAPWVRRVVSLEQTASTNADALRLAAEGEPGGTVVVADSQTAGRGRLDRSWWSQPGESLLVSWLIRPSLPAEEWPLLGLVAGVAAARALGVSTGVEVRLKWPNDLLAAAGKLGGILAESDGHGALVIGLGVNLFQTGFPPELVGATSVAAAGGRPVERAWLLAAILSAFGARMEAPADALDEYRSFSDTIGRSVRVERHGAEPLEGVALDVSRTGALILEVRDRRVEVASGDVVHLRDVIGG